MHCLRVSLGTESAVSIVQNHLLATGIKAIAVSTMEGCYVLNWLLLLQGAFLHEPDHLDRLSRTKEIDSLGINVHIVILLSIQNLGIWQDGSVDSTNAENAAYGASRRLMQIISMAQQPFQTLS